MATRPYENSTIGLTLDILSFKMVFNNLIRQGVALNSKLREVARLLDYYL